MPIELACPHCRRPMRVPDHAAGKRIQCPHCSEQARAPEVTKEPPDPHSNPLPGIASLVLGITGVVTSFIPFISGPLAILALVFACIGMTRHAGRGQAIAGLVLGIVGCVLSTVVAVVWWALYSAPRA